MKAKSHLRRYRTKNRIALRFNNCSSWEHCTISGRLFELGVGPGFFLDGDYGKPVCNEIALHVGFTVNPNDWQNLVDTYWRGMLANGGQS